MRKLGEVVEWGGNKYLCTTIYPTGFPSGRGMGLAVFTPIPEGMGPEDFGRRFTATAYIEAMELPRQWTHAQHLKPAKA